MATTSVISVVDNDASVRASINNFLRSLGYVVHTFWSAEEFLGPPQLNDTSCVIAAIQMSTMDGLELLANFITAFPDESARALWVDGVCKLVAKSSTLVAVKRGRVVLTVILSWAATEALPKIPGETRVLVS